MGLNIRVCSMLLVSAVGKFTDSIVKLLPESKFHPVHVVSDVAAARRQLLEHQYDIIIINASVSEGFGVEFAIDISAGSYTGTMLLIKNENYMEIYNKVADSGVLVLSKPTTAHTVMQTVNLLRSMHRKLQLMEKKTISLEAKMEEIRIANRAKWLLISELGMNENEAHRYIEKQAMDRCVSKRMIAESIIKTYNKQ